MPIPLPATDRRHRTRAPRIARSAAAVLTATALLAGCGLFGSDDDPAPTTTTEATTSTTAAPVARSEAPELLDAGEAPRQELRLAYEEGDEAEITFTSDLEIRQDSEGRVQRIDSPPVAQTLTYVVDAVTDDGAELTIRVEAIAARGKGTKLTDDEVAAIDDQLAPLVGLEATATATPLGELEDLAFDVPSGLSEDLREQVAALEDQLPALGPALPSEPVGLGASWRSTSTSSVGGAEVETVATIEVTAIADGTLEYTSTIETSAAPQPLALAGLADGTSAQLLASELEGSATGTLGLDRLLVELRTRLSGTQQILLGSADGDVELSQALDVAYAATTASD